MANTPSVSGLIQQLDGLSAGQARAAFASIGGDGLSALSHVTMAETTLGLLARRVGTAGAGTGLAFSDVSLVVTAGGALLLRRGDG